MIRYWICLGESILVLNLVGLCAKLDVLRVAVLDLKVVLVLGDVQERSNHVEGRNREEVEDSSGVGKDANLVVEGHEVMDAGAVGRRDASVG